MCFTWWASANGCKYAVDAAYIAARAASRAAAVSAPRAAFCAAHPGVAQRFPALTASSERPCGVDRVARPRIGRLNALENLQDSLRALRGIAGDITKVLLAESNLSRFVRHGS
jgi:hypothetical protein